MAVPEDASGVYSLALQKLSGIAEHDLQSLPKRDVLERVRVVQEAAAASLGGWTLSKIYMAPERDKAHSAVERLNTRFKALGKHNHHHGTVRSELHDSQEPSFSVEVRWKSACE